MTACHSCGRTAEQGATLLHPFDGDRALPPVCEVCDNYIEQLQWSWPCAHCGHARSFHHYRPCEHGWDGEGLRCTCPEYRPRVDRTGSLPQASNKVRIVYLNWKGVGRRRTIFPRRIFFGSNEFHPVNQWLMEAWDVDTNSVRTFSMKDIFQWEPA